MMRNRKRDPRLQPLRWALRLTQAGMVAERALRAFWPLASVLMITLAAVMLGGLDLLPLGVVWSGAVFVLVASLCALAWGLWHFRWPRQSETLARLDASLPGRPVRALLDSQATGAGDAGSMALWLAHQQRMARAAAAAKPPTPNLRIAAADPFALRYVALLALVMALGFGSLWRVGSLGAMVPGGQAGVVTASWEGWIEPPRYTGLPVLYLNDQQADRLELPEGSRITLRFYGSVGALALKETVSASVAGTVGTATGAAIGSAAGTETGATVEATAPEHAIEVQRNGDLEIRGEGGRSWSVAVLPDKPPQISVTGLPELTEAGALSLPYMAQDDYGVIGGEVRIALDEHALQRRHGLRPDPEPREVITLPLPLPLSGSRQEFSEFLIEDFAGHPWANLPVVFSFTVRDAAGQSTTTAGLGALLVAPRFFDPLAAAVAEQRRDILWSGANAGRIAQVLRAVSHRPASIFREAGSYLQLRGILRRLEGFTQAEQAGPGLSGPPRDEIAAALWALAQSLEEGDIGDALARMQQAKERLSQAMRDGASDEEIAQLMQKLREATQDYMRQLQRQAQRDRQSGAEDGEQQQAGTTLSQQDLQAMMDHIQELMEQGRMAEAEQALEEFQRMMENMRMSQNQQGEGGSQGQQAMEGLGETLREQQGLSDQAFRDLQEQFNPNAQAGQSQSNEGRSGGQGRGQQHEGGTGQGSGQGNTGQNGSGQDGSGQDGSGQDSAGQQGQPGQNGSGGQPGQGGSLADRQQALRDELRRQQEGLPLGDEAGGSQTREALDRAGEAMDQAGEALRQGDLAGAIDRQSDAMEALREGMRALGEALAENQQPGQQPGQGQMSSSGQADPLGRDRNASGQGDERGARIGEGRAHRRAWDLLEELRRRIGEQGRSESERSYIERLLDQF
ncbi:hypothetical protein PH5382_01714 [Phaeobacter sp. CECT 5382]|uniref:TIGR02302 family protein n=1 Tax=Phaeobacter sp. CECT 5382 TaxID=1712645 RepID=UPI0006DA923A|nr:TIGR02302 family protein [Phaeobacter sp. CECT 5382]CUH87785.1 hypothetical protein PH5382_01714 [Phaeobacter sp. CECT 5382]